MPGHYDRISWRAVPIRLLLGLALAWLLPGATATSHAQNGQPAQGTPTIRDPLGRPLPWGPEVKGAWLSARLVRNRLVYGEPVAVIVNTKNPSEKGPYVRLNWDGPLQTAVVEMTTAQGKAVPFRRESRGGYSSVQGDYQVVQLWPEGQFALGRYWKPGKYQIRVVLEQKKKGPDANAWVGKLLSQTIPLEVVNSREELVPAALRQEVARLVPDLNAAKFTTCEKASQALKAIALEALPALEAELNKAESAQTKARLKGVLESVVRPVLEVSGVIGPIWYDVGPLLALYGEPTWQLLRDRNRGQLAPAWVAHAAMFGPVGKPLPGDDLSPAQVQQLVKGLTDKDPAVRIATIRQLPRTQNRQILKALVARLEDGFHYFTMGPGDPFPFSPVAYEAGEAIVYQGKPAIAPLIEYARKSGNGFVLSEASRLLTRLGADPGGLGQ